VSAPKMNSHLELDLSPDSSSSEMDGKEEEIDKIQSNDDDVIEIRVCGEKCEGVKANKVFSHSFSHIICFL